MQTLYVWSLEAHVISVGALRTFWYGRSSESRQFRYFGPASTPELIEQAGLAMYEEIQIIRRKPIEAPQEIFAIIELATLNGGIDRRRKAIPTTTSREVAAKYVRQPL